MSEIIKIGHVSDLHIGAGVVYGTLDPKRQLNTFTIAQEEALSSSVGYLAAKGCEYLIIPGDFFDTYDPKSVYYSVVQDFLGLCDIKGIKVIACSGNHDRANSTINAVRSLRPLNDGRFIYVGGEEFYEDDKIVVADANFEKWYNFTASKKFRIGLFHGIVPGVTLAGGFEPKPNITEEEFSSVPDIFMLGDIHLQQVLKIKNKLAVYPGSLVRLNFGEKNYEPGMNFYQVDSETKEVDFERVSNEWCSPRFIEATIRNEGDIESVVRSSSPGGMRVFKIEGPAELEEVFKKAIGQEDNLYQYAITSSGSSANAQVVSAHAEFDLRKILDSVDIPEWYREELKSKVLKSITNNKLAGNFYLKNLKVKNFGPYVDLDLNFKRDSSICIYGENGAGKSMITDAIKCCMFGTTYRGLQAGWCVNGEMATLELEWDGPSVVKLVRTIEAGTGPGKQNVKLFINGIDQTQDRKGDTQQVIEEAFGVSDQTFEICTNIGKADLSVVGKQSSWRVAYLMELFKLDALDEIGGEIQNAIQLSTTARSNAAFSLGVENAALVAHQMVATQSKEPDQFELVALQSRKEELTQQIGGWQTEIAGQVQKVQQHNNNLNLLKSAWEYANSALETIVDSIESIQDSIVNEEKTHTEAVNALNSNKCTVCGGNLSNEIGSKLIEESKVRHFDLSQKLAEVKIKKEPAEAVVLAKMGEYNAANLIKVVDESTAIRIKITAAQTELYGVDNSIHTINEAMTAWQLQASKTEQLQKVANSALAEHVHATTIQDFWYLIAHNLNIPDIKMRVVSSVSKFLNEKATYYLTKIFGSDVGVVCDASMKVTANKTITKFDIYVTRDGKQVPFEQYSGGEGGSVRIAVDLAMSELVASIYPSRFRFVILDEAFDKLSFSKAEAVTELIKELRVSRGTSFSMFHVFRTTSKFDMTLTVTKENRVSTVAIS